MLNYHYQRWIKAAMPNTHVWFGFEADMTLLVTHVAQRTRFWWMYRTVGKICLGKGKYKLTEMV